MMQGASKKSGNIATGSSKPLLSQKRTPGALKIKNKIMKTTASSKKPQKSAEGDGNAQIVRKDAKDSTPGEVKESQLNTGGRNEKKPADSSARKDEKVTSPGEVKGSQLNTKGRNKKKPADSNDKSVRKDGKGSSATDVTGSQLNTGGGNEKKSADNNGKKVADKQKEEQKGHAQNSDKQLGGLIFMCNTKTKPDCFHYRVMAVPVSKKEVVLGVKPGLKLFLYDFDLRLLYGIYEAASSGGLKLEPAAFGGAFPVQVRFKISKDCVPLPERTFRKAIEENYDPGSRKFKTELTFKQVRKLSSLFRPAGRFDSKEPMLVLEPLPPPVILHPPVAVLQTDERLGRNAVFHPNPGYGQATERNPPRESHGSSVGKKSREGAKDRKHDSELLYLSERDYRTYGLRGRREPQATSGPADEYHHHPYNYGATSSDPYPPLPAEPYLVNMASEGYSADPAYDVGHNPDLRTERRIVDDGRYPDYGTSQLFEHNQIPHQLGSKPEYSSLPVSSRYSFAGASISYR